MRPLPAPSLARADSTATMRDVANAPAILLIGNDPTERHPLLAWNIRNNVRLHAAKLYVVNSQPIKLRRRRPNSCRFPRPRKQAVAFLTAMTPAPVADRHHASNDSLKQLRDELHGLKNLVIIFWPRKLGGADIAAWSNFGAGLGAKFICLGDYANSAARRTWASTLICFPERRHQRIASI